MTREGAIKGLLDVADWHYGKYEQTHEEDYLNDGDFLTAVANMLKAQEPRVMALEEVNASKGNDIYLELSGCPDDTPYITAATLDGVGKYGVSFYHTVCNFCTYNRRAYGWRCWTSRPTDEQREAIPWN